MITQINAVSFRQNLGEMLNQVQYRRDSVLINKDGKPVAGLIDARRFERIRRMQVSFDTLCQRIDKGGGKVLPQVRQVDCGAMRSQAPQAHKNRQILMAYQLLKRAQHSFRPSPRHDPPHPPEHHAARGLCPLAGLS